MRFTIVITKIDVVSRGVVNDMASNIRRELAPYCDVDIMYVSNRSLRGIDHLWAKIWQSVTETPRGERHRRIGLKEFSRLSESGIPTENDLADLMGLPRQPMRSDGQEDFDSEEWADDTDFTPEKPGTRKAAFSDKWGEVLEEGDPTVEDEDDDDEWADLDEVAEGGPATTLNDLRSVKFDGELEGEDGISGDESDDDDDRLDFLGSDEELERRWGASFEGEGSAGSQVRAGSDGSPGATSAGPEAGRDK